MADTSGKSMFPGLGSAIPAPNQAHQPAFRLVVTVGEISSALRRKDDCSVRRAAGSSAAVKSPARDAQTSGQMALRKVTLIALGVSVSLLMGCPARMRQWDSANKLESNCYLTPGPPYRN